MEPLVTLEWAGFNRYAATVDGVDYLAFRAGGEWRVSADGKRIGAARTLPRARAVVEAHITDRRATSARAA